MHQYEYLQMSEEGAGSPGTGVTGICELPTICIGN